MHANSELEGVSAHRAWVFPMLTLDVVQPFYEMMGLRVGDPAKFQGALRAATVAERKRVPQMAAGGQPPSLAGLVRSVEATIGPAATEHLVWWLRDVFHGDPRDNLGVSDWVHVLRNCRHEPDLWQRVGFPEQLSEQALDRFRKANDTTDYDRRRGELEAQPLSDWDLHMYAAQLYDYDDDLQGASASPFLYVGLTITDYQGYDFWAWVLRTLDPDQLTRLWESTKQVVLDEELTSVTDLPHPSTLDIGL